MPKFEVVSEYTPSGDQPQAIEALSQGIEMGLDEQTLLGVTGSGKTFTMAKIIEQVQRPTLVLAHNKTLAAQLCAEFKEFFPNNAVAATLSTGQIPFFPPDMHIGKTYESPQCCARSLPGRSVPAPDIINKNLKPLHSSAPVFLFRAPSKKLPAFEDRADRRLLYFLTLSFPSVDSP